MLFYTEVVCNITGIEVEKVTQSLTNNTINSKQLYLIKTKF